MKSAVIPPQSDEERFLRRQMAAWLWTLSFPAYCALVRLLLVQCGYSTVRTLHGCAPGRPSDGEARLSPEEGGLDLLALCHTDLSTFVTAVGIKTGRVPVSRRLADEMRGAMQRAGADHGLLFATGRFSRRTRHVADTMSLLPLRLIDGDEMAILLIEHRLGVRRAAGREGAWQFDPRFFERLEGRGTRHAGDARR